VHVNVVDAAEVDEPKKTVITPSDALVPVVEDVATRFLRLQECVIREPKATEVGV
jgi:hypothetical protein